MTDKATPTARRYSPEELGELDLTLADSRVVWAESAQASSEWSSSYSASSACGPPAVFPRYGDLHGTWLAASLDANPHIDLVLPATERAHGLIICETCGAGAVRLVRDLERGIVLLDTTQTAKAKRGQAQLLVIPLDANSPPPRRVRLELRGRRREYQEIDAVGLLLAPLEELMAQRVARQGSRHQRFAPSELPIHDLRSDPRLGWATSAKASSEYSSSYGARHARGLPKVFPKGGDHDKTWLSDSSDRNAWLELSFRRVDLCYGFIALETCGAGAIVRASEPKRGVLWQSAAEDVPSREARLLWVEFDEPITLSKLRLHVSPRVSDYREIDAVALLSCPFADLATPAPPPPPPPIPGEPTGGFVELSGALETMSETAPLLHLTVSCEAKTHNLNHGGPARLRLDDGRELPLEIGETVIYGVPLRRRRGPFGTLADELPWLREALGAQAPDDASEASIEGTQLLGGARVFVAGTPTAAPARGFREAAGGMSGVVAAALSDRPLDSTPFRERGVHEFAREPTADPDATTAPHPFARWRRVSVSVAAFATLLFAAATWSVADVRPLSGGRAVVLILSLTAMLASFVFALELQGRVGLVTVVEDGGRAHRGRVRATSPGWTAVGTAFVMFLVSVAAGGIAGNFPEDALEPTLRLGLIIGGLHALVRVVLWRWQERGALRAALPLLLARTGRLDGGARGVFTGALGRARRTREALTSHVEHLGTYQSTDEEGRVTTHDRYRTWNESRISCDAGRGTVLYLADGNELRAGKILRVVDAGVRPGPLNNDTYVLLESAHHTGDPASLLGRAVPSEGGGWVVEDAVLLLGERRALRDETLRQLLALAGLLALVALGVLAALV